MTSLSLIHKTAIIAEGAQIHETVDIGPYAVIGPNVKVGAGTKIGAHVVIDGHTTIGENCHIFAGAAIGLEPQDLKYKNEATGVVIGNNCVIREYVTIHRATHEGNTIIGDNCFLMNYTHIAHNCVVGNAVIMANATTLAGHVEVGDGSVFAGMVVMHQHTKVGRFCMVGGMTGSRVDLPPFTLTDGRPAMVRGINVIGLRRNKMGPDKRAAIKKCYKLLYRSGLNHSQAIAKIQEEVEQFEEVKEVCDFFANSKRGVAPTFGDVKEGTRELGEVLDAPVDEF
ncbi:MAG: acyl-ACP--UDP-N-acetylglucosamine O-acyltransferase [Candidatus Obscuribacterales bacterium]|nr:acyl-ACP--UDP-N-acetylglucosamine O-acyltransferase [Candidatus Obscuribacterales bacterium]